MDSMDNPPGGGEKTKIALWEMSDPRLVQVWIRYHGRKRRRTKLLGIITVDVGDVILMRMTHMLIPLPPKQYSRSPLMEFVIPCVRLLILFFGPRQFFILKNEAVPQQGASTLRTLRVRRFFQYTGVLDSKEHYILTEAPHEKGDQCRERGVNFHIDNSDAVGAHLPEFTTYVRFQGRPGDPVASRRAVSERTAEGKLRVLFADDWLEVTQLILDSYRIEEAYQVFRSLHPKEQAEVVELMRKVYTNRRAPQIWKFLQEHKLR